jgi:hypothetical protein
MDEMFLDWHDPQDRNNVISLRYVVVINTLSRFAYFTIINTVDTRARGVIDNDGQGPIAGEVFALYLQPIIDRINGVQINYEHYDGRYDS